MRVLWEHSRGTVGDIAERIEDSPKPAYNSVLTMLRILETKGYVRHEKDGRAFVYAPVIGRGEARRSALSHLIHRFFDDSPALLVLDLLGHDEATPAEFDAAARTDRSADAARPVGGNGAASMSAVFAWLWQGLLLAAVVDLLLRAMPRLNAATRHVVWWATLAGVILLGAIDAAGGSPAAVPVAAAPQGDPASLPSCRLALPHAPGWLILSAMWAWLGLTLYRLGTVARSLRHVAALRATSVALDPERAARFSGLAERTQPRRAHGAVCASPTSGSARARSGFAGPSSSCRASGSIRSMTTCSTRW